MHTTHVVTRIVTGGLLGLTLCLGIVPARAIILEDTTSIEELRLLQPDELAEAGGQACGRVVILSKQEEEWQARPATTLTHLTLHKAHLQKLQQAYHTFDRVALVARAQHKGKDPAWVTPMSQAIHVANQTKDFETGMKRCTAIMIEAYGAAQHPKRARSAR